MERSVEEQIQKFCGVPENQRSKDAPNMQEYFKSANLRLVLAYTISDEFDFHMIDNVPIYHYTSQNGLKEILEHNSLWFTDSAYLNDVSEGKHIYSVVSEVLEEYRDGGADFRKFKNHVRDTILNIDSHFFFNYKNWGNFGLGWFATPHYFICSFCQENDILGMWNYYTKSNGNIGANIKFLTVDLANDIADHLKNINFTKVHTIRVLYDKQKQKELIKECIAITYYYWQRTNNKDNVMQSLAQELLRIKSSFKHPAFENEREIRLVIEMSAYDFDKNMSDDKLLLRQSNGGFIPYINVCFDKNDVKGIHASPNMRDFHTIGFLLQKYGYSRTIPVSRSTIPLRP